MSTPKSLPNFKALTSAEPTHSDWGALENELYGSNDRVVAIMLGSMVERSLFRLLVWQRGGDPETATGDREKFYDKIQVAEKHGLIGPIIESDLQIIRFLRNGFAHTRMPISLETPEVVALCAELQSPDLPGAYIPFRYMELAPVDKLEHASDRKFPRTRFISACTNLAHRMLVARTPVHNLPENLFADKPLP